MPFHIDSLAQVYARSLFELAEQAGGRDKILEVYDELEQIGELSRGDRTFCEFLASPLIDRGRRAESVRRMFSDRITDLTLRFLLVLNEKRRLGHLEAITAAYDRMVQDEFGRVEVDVLTAGPLGPEQFSMLRARIQEALHREPVLHSYTDPSMIGGLKLRIGDQLIDASVASQLRRMRQHLMASGGAAVRDRLRGIIEEQS